MPSFSREPHILRRTPLAPRRPRRPSGDSPLFLEDAFTIDAVTELAKSRGAWISDDLFVSRVLTWTEDGRSRYRPITLPVVSTVQPFGGQRHWLLVA